MKFDELVPSQSKYLAKNDVGEEGKNLTIKGFKKEELKGDDGVEEKAVCYWEEDFKPMIINRTNASRLAAVLGVSDTGEARGKVVNVYNDPLIDFGGKIVGGLRIRKATGPAAEKTAAPHGFDDDIGF